MIRMIISLLLLASTALAQDAPNTFRVEKVADGVYAFVASPSASFVVNGNTTAIIGDQGVVVVDAGQFPLTARRVIDEIRKLTDQPVRVVVSTHWHADHNLANAEYQRAFPGVVLLAHEQTRRLMVKNRDRVMQLPTEGPPFHARLKAALERGTTRDGKPFTAEQKQQLTSDFRDLDAVVADLKLVEFAPPTATFGDAATIHLGKREVRVLHLGKGSTGGDAIVHVPDADVLITGDVVVAPVPYGFGSHPASWERVLEKLIAMNAAAIVPGHGPVMRDSTYLQRVSRLLSAIRAQVGQSVRAGHTLEETTKRLDVAALRQEFTHGNAGLERVFQDFFLSSIVPQAYKEAIGEPVEE